MFRALRKWLRQDDAVIAIEAGMLFPVLIGILCGTMDMGVGLLVNQKVINSSQTIGDLLGREENITDEELGDAIVAGRMSLQPYTTATYGIDVAGIQFIGDELEPTEQWRDTENMEPNLDVLEGSAGLGTENEGVIAVTVRYEYQPYFAEEIVGVIEMEEVAYVRGRSGLFVTRGPEE